MKKRASLSHPGLPYDAFLFEPLGEDRNGAPLALASLLGRMSLDPWHEAALLAAMPADVAAKKLASLIEAIPNRSFSRPQSNTLADHLVKLLPRRPEAVHQEPEIDSVFNVRAQKGRRLVIYLSWIVLACVLLMSATFG